MTAPTHTQPASLRGDAPAKRERVFSGIQPSGNIHIGNLLGVVRNWVRDQDKFDNIYCIGTCTRSPCRRTPRSCAASAASWPRC